MIRGLVHEPTGAGDVLRQWNPVSEFHDAPRNLGLALRAMLMG